MSKYITSLTTTGVNSPNVTNLITGTLSSAQLLSLTSTMGISLIPAAGSDTVIAISQILWEYKYGTITYVPNSSIVIAYNSNLTYPAWSKSTTFGNITNTVSDTQSNFSNYISGFTQDLALSSITNQPVTILTDGVLGFTLGNGTVNYSIYYRVVNV